MAYFGRRTRSHPFDRMQRDSNSACRMPAAIPLATFATAAALRNSQSAASARNSDSPLLGWYQTKGEVHAANDA